MTAAAGVVGVVLAAGSGSRFGGGKMLAPLDGSPLPAHVLAAVRAAGIERFVAVLGRDASAVDAAMRIADPGWGSVLRALNPAPERGLASSLRLGLTLAAALPGIAGVLVLLGDQPHVSPAVIRALLDARPPDGCRAIAPRYADDGAPNPVLVLPAGFALAAAAEGDRGLGPLLAAEGEGVFRVPVNGANPDVDTRDDLVRLASDRGSAE